MNRRSSPTRWWGGPLAALWIAAAPPLWSQDAAGVDGREDADVEPIPEVEYRLERVRARRGDSARLVFAVRTLVPLKSIAVALDFDETRLRVRSVMPMTFVEASPARLDSRLESVQNNHDAIPGSQSDEGWVFARLDTDDSTTDLGVSTGDIVPVLLIQFHVLEDAEFGFSPIRFSAVGRAVDGVPAEPFDNEVEAADLDGGMAPPPVAIQEGDFVEGGIEIIGEVGFFMRGDANFDEKRNISDPSATLAFLFTSGPPLPCHDAADANDDGSLDVSDAIFTLTRLFVTSQPFPAPDVWGTDPTPDRLGCDIYTRS